MDPIAVVSGFGIGAIVGMTGVGGGSLMTPLLVLVAPFAVILLAAWGFVDNWLRSQPPARSAAT